MTTTLKNLTLHRPARVLVVEDEPRLCDLLIDVIPDMGFTASAVRTAEDALRQLEIQPCDILMLDLQLPAMSGMELFEIVTKRWPALRVIIMTGFGDLNIARQAIHLDVVDFINKPFHLNEIEFALDRALKMLQPPDPPKATLLTENPQPQTLAQTQRLAILAALNRHAGNRTAAAAELGISRRKLHYWLSANGGDVT